MGGAAARVQGEDGDHLKVALLPLFPQAFVQDVDRM